MINQSISANRAEKPIDETEEDLCRAMWLSVIVQAIVDVSSKSNCPEVLKRRLDVIQWLSPSGSGESDFEAVCNLAGVDPADVRKLFRRALSGETIGVDFRASKKALLKNRNQENRKRYFRRARFNLRQRIKRSPDRTKLRSCA